MRTGRMIRQSRRLSRLGWTQVEIGERLGVDRSLVSLDVKNCHLAKIHTDLGPDWNEKGLEEWAQRNRLTRAVAVVK